MPPMSVLGQPRAIETLVWIYEHPSLYKTKCILGQEGHGRITIHKRIDELTDAGLITQTRVDSSIILDVTELGAKAARLLIGIRSIMEGTASDE